MANQKGDTAIFTIESLGLDRTLEAISDVKYVFQRIEKDINALEELGFKFDVKVDSSKVKLP